MRWNFLPPTEPQPWCKWFAWYPVSIEQRMEYVWLEWVERKRVYMYDFTRAEAFWVYRMPNA